MAIDDLIRRADAWLRSNRPDHYAILRPGVDDAALDAYAVRFGLELPADLRQFYQWRDGQDLETTVQRCIVEGLVGGEGFAVDASLIHADAGDRNRVEGGGGLPRDAAGRAVEEYLAVLDDAAFGAATEVTPKFIAPSDPATRWTAAHRGPAFFRLLRQLPDRRRPRDHRRCRGDDGD
jgi:hypothetical protein